MAKKIKKIASNHINSLEIKNFKSIKHMKIEPKRINLFIGRPNVGKSNVLEGISLLSGYYSTRIHNNGTERKYLSDIIRYEQFDELFYDRYTGDAIEITSDLVCATVTHQYNPGYYHYLISDDKEIRSLLGDPSTLEEIKKNLNEYYNARLKEGITNRVTNSYQLIHQDGSVNLNDALLSVNNPIKKFDFIRQSSYPNRYHFYLLPPYGNNLYTVIKQNKKFQKEIAEIFQEYKLDFVMKSHEAVFEIQKKVKNLATSFPYSGVADTLQRYIFHLAAIRSNQNSVLLFEEPEAHNFPAYIRKLAEDIIADENNNQYFITTHSPFILNIILENAKTEDIAVFKLDYKNYQTKAEPLSDKEISNYLSFGTDIFFQLLK